MRTLTVIISFIFLLLFSSEAIAQHKELVTRVSHIAGTTIYLDIGRDDGMSDGDTLYIYIDATYRGTLIVENTASHSLSARYGSEELFPLTRGQQVTVLFNQPEIHEPVTELKTKRESILKQPAEAATEASFGSPILSGRVMTGSSILYTQTQWGDFINRTTDRTYISPFTDLNMSVNRLPNGFSVDAAFSYTYRYSSNQPIVPDHATRLYRLNIEKTFDSFPLTLSAGRFYNRYDIFSGYWDGVSARIGTQKQGFGIIGGFEPARGNERFSSDLPKATFFAYKEWSDSRSRFRSTTELAFNAVLPSIDMENHLFAGVYQQFRIDRSRFTISLQADQNPVNQKWIFSQTMVRGYVPLTEQWEIHGAYNRRLPYRMFINVDPFGYVRTQIVSGLTYRFHNGYLGGDIAFNDSEAGDPSRSYAGYGSVSNSRFWDLGYSAIFNYWENAMGHTLRASPGLNRDFGRIYLRLGYQFYQSEFLNNRNQTHGGELSIISPLFNEWYLNGRLVSEFGDLLINNSLFISIWKAF